MPELEFELKWSGSRGQTLNLFLKPPVFPTCPESQGPSLGRWPRSPLQLMDLLYQDTLLIPGQVPATLQLDLFFPGKNRPQEGDRRQGW